MQMFSALKKSLTPSKKLKTSMMQVEMEGWVGLFGMDCCLFEHLPYQYSRREIEDDGSSLLPLSSAALLFWGHKAPEKKEKQLGCKET